MPELDISDLVIEYRSGDYSVRPIDGLSLHIPPGSLVLLLGPSGCGKTTLLSSLGAMLTPAAGSIRFGDIDVGSLDGAQLTDYRRHRVGFVFQAFNLVPSLSALENVALPLRGAGRPKKEAMARAGELLETVDLSHRRDHLPGDMSGGQQQRVAIARSLALDPPLILADEPTAHLDFIAVEEVITLIRELASGDRTVVVSTHDSRMIPLADEVVELVPDFSKEQREPEVVELAAGEVLFRQGDRAELVYVVDDGEVEVVREHADGTEEVRIVLGAGAHVGEMGPTLGLPRSATVRALAGARLTGLTVRALRERSGGGTHR